MYCLYGQKFCAELKAIYSVDAESEAELNLEKTSDRLLTVISSPQVLSDRLGKWDSFVLGFFV
ncbi:hypothetical protein [Pseudanabaena sp. UWO310]|uniref:hypothetical protein n=1 Tax=Pseudanabaena sp. UWO310 TaxID=2480795 RepID=UPI0011611105|nr:hypothetical protein [Pseudanabaena sp. UWO310]TYQ23809.1 hypothetical protein PseudUWO310_21780 [Pseudanabaena sp. UWO310]